MSNGAKIQGWLLGALAWAVPGAGHAAQGKWGRGLLLGGSVWALFIAGWLLGGHLFDFMDFGAGLLSQVFGVFDLGTGLIYIVSRMIGIGAAEEAQRVTYEYGNVLMMVAGLVNYLAMLDTFDIRVGRKS